MTLTFNPLRDMVMTYSHAKVQGQRSFGSEDRVETNGWTDGQMDGGDRVTSLANAVTNIITKVKLCYNGLLHTVWKRPLYPRSIVSNQGYGGLTRYMYST